MRRRRPASTRPRRLAPSPGVPRRDLPRSGLLPVRRTAGHAALHRCPRCCVGPRRGRRERISSARVPVDSRGHAMTMRAVLLALALIAVADRVSAQTILDFVTFDGIHYLRWTEEPGRALTREDLGIEFATIECSIGEDRRACAFGLDAAAAFMPAGTRMYAVRGYRTDFRLAAVVRDRIFLYQAWRSARAKVGGD